LGNHYDVKLEGLDQLATLAEGVDPGGEV
jgi:hypothetical protein